jgi:hypothetical protein
MRVRVGVGKNQRHLRRGREQGEETETEAAP